MAIAAAKKDFKLKTPPQHLLKRYSILNVLNQSVNMEI